MSANKRVTDQEIDSVDFRGGVFVFGDGSTFPAPGEVLPQEELDAIKATGAYVASQIELSRRTNQTMDSLLDTEAGRNVFAAYIAQLTNEAHNIIRPVEQAK